MRNGIIFVTACVLLSVLGCGSSGKPAATSQAAPPVSRGSAAAMPVASARIPASVVPAAPEPAGLRVSSSDALGPGARIADMAAAAVPDGMLLAWVTYVDRPPDQSKKRAPAGPAASIVARALTDQGNPIKPATTISARAESMGGVAMATGADGAEVCVAWTGIDQGRAQVFLTRVGPDGQKRLQRMISRGQGTASDVTLVAAPDGWIVGWVETLDKDVQVHVAKVSQKLDRVGPERVISRHPGDASEVRAVVRGGDVLVAWADARAGLGASDIYTAKLALSDLSWRADEARLSSKPDHARGLRLAARGDDVVIAWIDAPSIDRSAAAAPDVAVIGQVDSSGRLRAALQRVALDGPAASVGVGCDRSACKVALASAGGELLVLSGFVWDASGPIPKPRKIASFDRVATEDVSLNVLGEWLFFAEDNLKGEGRIRKLRVAWE
jgi:hypothetical protein